MLLDRSLITRTSLQDVGRLLQFSEAKDWKGFRQYSNTCDPVSLVLLDNINAVWDKKKKIKLKTFKSMLLGQNTILHRWIVLDAIESASSVPQKPAGVAAIAAARAWLIDPSESNRISSEAAANAAYTASYTVAAAYYSATAAYYVATAAADARGAAYNVTWAATTAADARGAEAARDAAELRIRVLATIQDYLPEPV